jgi:TRAP-type C4-dicarboxylate transport system permease small subunit
VLVEVALAAELSKAIFMNKLLAFTEILNRAGVWVGGTLLFLTSGMIAVEVVLRKVFSVSMGGADELSSYVLAISCSWAFGFALLRKAHIRIDILYTRLPEKIRSILDILSLLTFMVYLAPLVYFAYWVVRTSVIRHSAANTPLQTPLWIPQGLWLAGLTVFLFTIVVLLVGTVIRLAKKDIPGAQQLSGPNTLEEEIEEESGIHLEQPSPGGKRW